MAIDFPASDQSPFEAPNGVTYEWNAAGYWEVSGTFGPSGDSSIEVSDTPPANPSEGDLWWDSSDDSGRLYVWYEDGNSNQWVETSPAAGFPTPSLQAVTDSGNSTTNDIITSGDIQATSLNGGPLSGFRNQITNGDFRVWQRGTTTADFTFTDTTQPSRRYIADRWYQNQDSVASTARRVGPGGDLPSGYAYALLMSTFEQLCQAIELPADGTPGQFAVGTQWTLSYWCNEAGSIATESPSVQFRETGAASGSVAVTTSAFGAPIETVVVGAQTWRRFSSTFTIDASPTANHDQLRIGFSNGAAGGRITGVQFEPGPVATPFEHRPYGTELALCQRYYQVVDCLIYGAGTNTVLNGNANFATEMRAAPTLESQDFKAAADQVFPGITGADEANVSLTFPNQILTTITGLRRARHTGLTVTSGRVYASPGNRSVLYGFDAEL